MKDLATDIYYEIERRFPSVTKSIQERMPLEPVKIIILLI